MDTSVQINTLQIFVPNEIEKVAVVDSKELEFGRIMMNVNAKIIRDQYPFSICVDGMASR